MLRAILNESWRQRSTKQQLYGHLPPITKTIKVRRTRHAGYCWRSREELISDVLLWTPSHGRAKAGWPAWTYIQQLCEDTGCSPEDLLEAMNDREEWRERVRDIRAGGMTRWWWDDISKVKLATLVEGDLKAPFSIATKPRCRGGHYSFRWIASLYSWSPPYNAVLSKAASSTIFWVFGMAQPGIEPRSPRPLANTLLIKPIYLIIIICSHTVIWLQVTNNNL